MLVERLVEYAARLDLPPPLYSEAPVRYLIDLDANGGLLNPDPTDTADPASQRTKRGQPHRVPQVGRTVAVKPLLLADGADYTLGLGGPTAKPERVRKAHAAYLDLLARCAAATAEPAVRAVLTFLQSEPLARLVLPADFDPDALITFQVEGQFVVDLPAVQRFWADENDPEARAAARGGQAVVMQCLSCGQRRPVLARLQGKIKGVPGGQTSGMALISANAEAFYSYGLEASLIAPTCAECGERLTKGLNHLLAAEQTHLIIGDMVFIFWTREPDTFFLGTMLNDPQPEQVRDLIRAVQTGKERRTLDEGAFYASVLSASGARVAVRDWIDTTVGAVRRQLAAWFAAQAIVDAYGGPSRPLGLYALAAATVRDPRKDLSTPTPRALLRAALTGTPLPLDLLARAVRRNHAERDVTRPRAALIKLVLLSNHFIPEEDAMTELELSNTTPGYLCGRLLAVLEQAQRLAIPGLNATLVDRYYGTASSAPATVFGTLLSGAQAHLSKLERDRPGAYQALQRRLEEIMAGLPGFPLTLTLQDQALFALGYYHQRAADRAGAQAASTRKAAAATASANDESTSTATDTTRNEEDQDND